MLEVRYTDDFKDWIDALKDRVGARKIASRIDRIPFGNFGDVKPVGQGVSELRIQYGPGYRVYFTKQDNVIVIILCGGSKKSQTKDIKKAKELSKQI